MKKLFIVTMIVSVTLIATSIRCHLLIDEVRRLEKQIEYLEMQREYENVLPERIVKA